jgi:hypothetical protein
MYIDRHYSLLCPFHFRYHSLALDYSERALEELHPNLGAASAPPRLQEAFRSFLRVVGDRLVEVERRQRGRLQPTPPPRSTDTGSGSAQCNHLTPRSITLVDTEGTGMTSPSAEASGDRAASRATADEGTPRAPSTTTSVSDPVGTTPTRIAGVRLPATTAPTSRIGTPRATPIVSLPPGAPTKPPRKKQEQAAASTTKKDKGKTREIRAPLSSAARSTLASSPPTLHPQPSAPAGSSQRQASPIPERVRFSSPVEGDFTRVPTDGDPDVAFSVSLSPGRPGVLHLPVSPRQASQGQRASGEPMQATPSFASPPESPIAPAPATGTARYGSARREAGVHQPLLHTEPSLAGSPSGLPLSGFPEEDRSSRAARAARGSSASQSWPSSSGLPGRPLTPATGIAFEPEAVQPFVEDILVKSSNDKLSLYERVLRLSQVDLDKYFVEDLGVRLSSDPVQIYRFKLNGEFLDELYYQVSRVQQLVDAIARYVPKPHFNGGRIDPGGHLVRSLQGNSDLNMLHIDFKVLTRRISDAAERIRQLDGRDHVSDAAISPVQTTSSWAGELDESKGVPSPTAVTKIYLKHPRLQSQLPSPSRAVLEDWIASDRRSPPTEKWSPLLSVLMPKPGLHEAFPPRDPEQEPRKVYYPAMAEHPATAFQSGASSYGQSRHWQVPPMRSSTEEREVEGMLTDDPAPRDHPSRRERRAAIRESKRRGDDVKRARPSGASLSAVHALRAGPDGPDGGGGSSSDDDDKPNDRPLPRGTPRSARRNSRPRTAGPGAPPPYGPLSGEPPEWSDDPSSPSSSDSDAKAEDKGRRRDRHTNSMRLDTKISTKDLPSWDGGGLTAVDFFYDIDRLADKGRRVRKVLGRYLPDCLESGSGAQMFYDTSPPSWKRYMRSQYTRFVWTFQRYFLTDRWTIETTNVANLQRFRQRGHEQEQPVAYLNRRIRFIRVLGLAEAGSQAEVAEMLRFAPPSWKGLLDQRSILTVYQTAAFHMEQLVEMANVLSRAGSSRVDDAQLLRALGRLGVQVASSAPRRTFPPRRAIVGPLAHANVAAVSDTRDEEAQAYITEYETAPDETEDVPNADVDDSTHDDAMAEVYATLKKKPPGGPAKYAWSKRDDIKTATGKLPPYGCRQCGSEKHWNRECPYFDLYEQKAKGQVNFVEQDPGYVNSYAYIVNKTSLHLYTEGLSREAYVSTLQSDYERFVHSRREINLDDDALAKSGGEGELETYAQTAMLSSTKEGTDRRLTVVPDMDANSPMPGGSLSTDDPRLLADVDELDEFVHLEDEWSSIAMNAEGTHAPNNSPLRIGKLRSYDPGRSAAGVSVLATSGWLGSTSEKRLDLRLDSCADVTLLSDAFWKGMKNRPKLKRGVKMRLYQLTDKDSEIVGYVDVPIIMETRCGELIQLEAEAYVVSNMTVDILLGEDFQQNYGIGVRRIPDVGTTITFEDQVHIVDAAPVDGLKKKPVERTSLSTKKVDQAIEHRRRKNTRRRARSAERRDVAQVRAAESMLIEPGTTRRVKVSSKFGSDGGREWFIDRNLASGGENGEWLAVAPTLIRTDNPYVPVANPSSKPLAIRRGDVLGVRVEPDRYFDSPSSAEAYLTMHAHASRIASLINAKLDAEENQPPSSNAEAHETHSAVKTEPEPTAMRDEEDYGPKTSELPDNTVYPSAKLEELLDVGDLPEHLRAKAWDMLRRRQRAFGFDDRLGKHPTRVHVRTAEGQVPISVPMYGSSPEKRRVIEEQVKKWLELEVIEPSRSPWGAPVVIAYRNGKARFCVDYRRLNAVTTPDEFPIPRQSDIMAALSGAQILSTLDALSGFLQLEMAPEDVEKTGFRTHLGLYHFLRMPFGLRNGPAIFQRVMQEILSPFLWLFCLVYIDDIVVYSKSFEEHIDHLDQVLGAIEHSGITLSPKKCHMFYSSILLLGHKVSRLGLSTHEEKVRAILELKPPSKVSELQTFLGMIVYFSAFIPYYASIARPLFHLLRKDTRWRWEETEHHAFEAAKEALRSSPVLGHPIQGLPYRLYTDASDEALGCALQQIQPIQVGDLKGTRTYERLQKAYEAKAPPPKLVVSLSLKINDADVVDSWGSSLDDSVVHVERVVAYWSRSFKGPETRYSATEREALGAKEGLVKFLPFIEGEQIILVTDHAALQWAKTYENTNRRLAAWGAVFAAYPGLRIVHRAGRVHSNVDPLSRLPRAPPEHTSPAKDSTTAIRLDREAEDDRFLRSGERVNEGGPTSTTLAITHSEAPAVRRSGRQVVAPKRTTFSIPGRDVPKKSRVPRTGTARVPSAGVPDTRVCPDPMNTLDSETPTLPSDDLEAAEPVVVRSSDPLPLREWEEERPLPSLTVRFSPVTLRSWVEAYQTDGTLKSRWKDKDANPEHWRPGRRYVRDHDGLLYFLDADFSPRLCVPASVVASVLREHHESPLEGAHSSTERMWQSLKDLFFWPRMKRDIKRFCESCDVCQKTKPRNFSNFGFLKPNDISGAPYESVSLDLIGPLPASEGYTAILVVVDRLSKHAQFLPTVFELNTEGFAYLFVRHVICRYGLPRSIYADRDGRWLSDFWTAIAGYLKTRMLLSSARHPQHDGQTEIVNRQLEIMLRAYVAEDQSSWAHWLAMLEHAYNSTVHSSTGYAPYQLMYGFTPKGPLDYANPRARRMQLLRAGREDIDTFLTDLETHRQMARNAVAAAQEKQAHAYDAGRRHVEFAKGSQVLVNPHSLEWLESKGAGAKLRQRWIGPYEVADRVSLNTYRIKLPKSFPGSGVINVEHLRQYRASPPEFGTRATLPDTRQFLQEGETYEVDAIRAHRYDRRRRNLVYLTSFKGYSSLADKWLTARNLSDVPDVLRAYQLANDL